jgi:hypothetical protein
MQKEHTRHHHHEHGHEKHSGELNAEKLKALIPYLQKHNQDHIEDLQKWQLQAREAGFDDVAKELGEIIELSKHIERHFATALDIIQKRG